MNDKIFGPWYLLSAIGRALNFCTVDEEITLRKFFDLHNKRSGEWKLDCRTGVRVDFPAIRS